MVEPSHLAEAKPHSQQAIQRDGHLVWSTPITAAEVATRFALTRQLKERAASIRREARHSRAVRSMPDVVNGRQMSSFLLDGSLLCGEWQTKNCSKSETECGAPHRCGVLLKTGRVCGGRHTGLRCHDNWGIKVAVGSVADTPAAVPSSSGQGAPDMPSGPIRKRPLEPREGLPPKAKVQPKKRPRQSQGEAEVGGPPRVPGRPSVPL